MLAEQRELGTGLNTAKLVPEAVHEQDDDVQDDGRVCISREHNYSRHRLRPSAFGQSHLQQRMVGNTAQHTSQSEENGRPDTQDYFGDDDKDSDASGDGSDDWSTQATAGEEGRDELTLPIWSRPLARPPPADHDRE